MQQEDLLLIMSLKGIVILTERSNHPLLHGAGGVKHFIEHYAPVPGGYLFHWGTGSHLPSTSIGLSPVSGNTSIGGIN